MDYRLSYLLHWQPNLLAVAAGDIGWEDGTGVAIAVAELTAIQAYLNTG